MSELKQLKFPSIYTQLARDFIRENSHFNPTSMPIEQLFKLLKIPALTLQDPHSSLTGKQIEILIAVRQIIAKDDIPFSLQIFKLFKEDTLGVLGLAVLNSETSMQALELFQKYLGLYTPGFEFKFSNTNDYVDISIEPIAHFDQLVEKTIIELVFCFTSYFFTRTGISSAKTFRFPHSLNGQQALYQTSLDATIEEGGNIARIRFSNDTLNKSPKSPNVAMLKLYIEQLEQQAEHAQQHEAFSFKAKRIMYKEAQQGIFLQREELANEMACSYRTLTRKLKQEGTSFQNVLDDTRLRIAKQALFESERSIKQISQLVGIQNPAIFCRSFKKWTGKSPGDYRKARNLVQEHY